MNAALTLAMGTEERTQRTPISTNREFLAAIFTGLRDDERPLVLDIKGPINDKTRWPAGFGWTDQTVVDNPSQNWYFTLSVFRPKADRYRRRKDQFARSYGVMLDDIGSKAAPRSRLDSCPPSYLIETSSGNYQAGYLFVEPCIDLARVDALQKSIIAAGLCDPGADGPAARIGRMPFAVNGKYDPPHACRLVEWHPERRYSIDQIVELLELDAVAGAGRKAMPKSGSKSTARERSAEGDIYLPRAAENAVVGALRQRGLYKMPLGDGKHDVTCPWVHEHCDAIDHGTAYFEPTDLYPVGGFKCLHSHGIGKPIGTLLEFLGVSFTEAKHKPCIRVAAGELHRVIDAAEQELAACGRYYQRGGLIVGIATDPATGETTIKPVTSNALMRALSWCATWERFDVRANDFVNIDPPARHVNVLFDSDAYQHLPVLRGIARQPYLRADGSLMTSAGFDSATGMFGAFDERAFTVPLDPDRHAAEQALVELMGLLSEFSFARPNDMAAALSLILTAAIRPSLRVALMGHIKAPQIASGKSYLSAIIASFGGPGRASAYAFPTNEEECAKLLLSALLESPPVIIFDNLTTDLIPFKTLCSVLTEEHITGRVLGVSKTATVPTQTLFLSSGNNVDAVRDMTRRVLAVTLDPQCETPATRTFLADPLALVQRERERFVSLALTIVRAYIVAGRPTQKFPPLGSYEEWSRLVRAPLVWLGLPDPATSMFARMAEDPDRELLGRLLVAWHQRFGDAPTSVRDVVEWSGQFGFDGVAQELLDALREIAEERGAINRRRLGRWIARHQGRIVNGLKFERDSKAGGSERWRVKVVSGVSGIAPSQGTPTVPTPSEASSRGDAPQEPKSEPSDILF